VPRPTQELDQSLLPPHTGLSPSAVGHSRTVLFKSSLLTLCFAAVEPYNPQRQVPGFGLLRVRSPLLAELFLFLGVLRCFSSPGALPRLYRFKAGVSRVRRDGLPHSEIVGLMPADGSPTLFAACHVLLRPLAPRHPPYALSSLFSGFDSLEVLAHRGAPPRSCPGRSHHDASIYVLLSPIQFLRFSWKWRSDFGHWTNPISSF
jgi:hypothetical protein